MKLNVGERLDGAGPARQPGGYLVTGVVRETPWYGLYAGKKVFYNFDFSARRVRETDEKEWLDVFLRTIHYPVLDDPDYAAQRRALARVEVRAVLGSRTSSLWPEPIDLLEIENTRDRFAFAGGHDTEPVVVFARPHGLTLPEWQAQVLPLTSVLSVLAELLEFLRQAHEEGLLLLGLCPDVVVVDPAERVHYVGSDTALLKKSPLLQPGPGGDAWSRLYPTERFPRGFSAPECYQPGARPDARSDLFAWGCVAYHLLTGDDPTQIARGQGRAWPTFEEEHLTRAARALEQVPAADRETWADQLGLARGALLNDWPGHLVHVLRLVLSSAPARRPGSATELRSWLVSPPIPAVAGLVALQTRPGEAKLFIDGAGLDVEAGLRVRRKLHQAPAHAGDGELVYDGPLKPVITDRELPLLIDPVPTFYSVFTAKTLDDRTLFSAAVTEESWAPEPARLRAWAEGQAPAAEGLDVLPPRVAMVLRELEAAGVAESLRTSPVAAVRGWGLRRLELELQAAPRFEEAEPVLRRFLTDPVAGLRAWAARVLWAYSPDHGEPALVALLYALENPPPETPVALGPLLRQLGVADADAARVLHIHDQRQPTTCPVCDERMTVAQRAEHLRSRHGYVDDEGEVVAPAVLLGRLWTRVLAGADGSTHDRLLSLYEAGIVGAKGTDPLLHYVADLGSRLDGRHDGVAGIEPYVSHLRRSRLFPAIARHLLRSTEERLRELGREALLPVLADRMRDANGSADRAWAVLEEACPGPELLEERIALCRRLPALGVTTAGRCLARLQDERLVRCTACYSSVRQGDLELHLRRAHRVYEFRGRRGTFDEVRSALLEAVCASPTDLKAWRTLQELAEEKDPRHADLRLVAWLFRFLRAQDRKQRQGGVAGVAEAVASGPRARALAAVMTGPAKSDAWHALGCRVALEVAGRVEPSRGRELLEVVRPLLGSRTLPRKCRLRAVVGLLKSTGSSGPPAEDLLRAFVAGRNKPRALERLRQVEQRFGPAAAIDAVRGELEKSLRMSCPRCAAQLPKKDMEQHLWDRHHLVLDGQRVREPARVLEDWAAEYAARKEPELLQRCRDLAIKLDPRDGVARLHRLLLNQGARDRDVLSAVFTQARQRGAGVCPHCFGLVPVTPPEPPDPLTAEGNELAGYGYRVEVADGVLFPSLTVETSDEVLHAGREPGRGPTRVGAACALVVPVVALAFAFLYWLTGGAFHAILLLLVAGGLGLMLMGVVFLFWPAPPTPTSRVLRAAWEQLVPHVLGARPGRAGWSFLHGLAGQGGYTPPRPLLGECLAAVEPHARSDPHAALALAALCRLFAGGLREAGQDAVSFVAGWVIEVMRGNASLVFGGALLDDFVQLRKNAWKVGESQRLQVLVAARAFEEGIAVDDLTDLARAQSTVREALGLGDRWRWSQLELLWLERDRKPWDWAGRAATVFELAEAPHDAEPLLDQHPDVLLVVRRGRLHVTSRGVWVRGELIGEVPAGTALRVEQGTGDRAGELRFGPHRIRAGGAEEAEALAGELEDWLRFYFEDFLPRLPTVRRPARDAAVPMWRANRVACPECGRGLVPCPGDLGIVVK